MSSIREQDQAQQLMKGDVKPKTKKQCMRKEKHVIMNARDECHIQSKEVGFTNGMRAKRPAVSLSSMPLHVGKRRTMYASTQGRPSPRSSVSRASWC